MKRLITFILATVMIIGILPITPAVAAEIPTFSVSEASGSAGDEVTVAVNVKSNPGVVVIGLKIGYDSSVLELKSASGKDFADTSFGPISGNPFHVTWEDVLSPNNTNNGVIAELKFLIKENAPLGDSAITVTYDAENVFNSGYNNVYFATQNGKVTVTVPCPHTDKTHIAKKASTCKEQGWDAYSVCNKCGQIFNSAGEEITDIPYSALSSHSPSEPIRENEIAAGCNTAGGYDEVIYCSVCNAELSREHKTVKASHTFGNWVITKAATCTAAGTRQHTCSVCKTVETESYTLETTAHKYGEWTVTKNATCIEDGLRERTCIYCGYVQKNVLPKEQYGDHAWEPGRIEPTCTEGGHECFICKYCGDMQLGAWIPPIDHKYEKTVVPANCTESGYTVYTCSVCGNSYTADYTPAKGHKYTVTVTDPTCTEDGYTTHTCTVCGDSYITNRVSAPGHNFGDWTIVKPATETENGLKQRICRTCGEVESEVIPMTGDNHEANCPSKDMTDVIKTAWYHNAVDYVLDKGYFAGISKTSFEPNTVMSRAMLVQVLYKMEGSPKVAFKLTFSDVKAGQWYSNAVIWAADNDIVAGLGNGKFDPTGVITREQLAVILYNYSMKKGRNVTARGDLGRFKDAGSTSSWAKTAVEWAVGEGLISGTNVGLEPKGKASRAQVAQILMNYEK